VTRWAEIEERSLSPRQREVFEELKKSRGFVRGPFRILLHSPELAERVARMGEYIRYRGQLSAADRELAILVCAVETGARYEWFEHEAPARSAGVRSEVIEALRSHAGLDFLTEREMLIISLIHELCREKSLSDTMYRAAVEVLSEKLLLELVALVGYYTMLGLMINTFDINPPAGTPPTF